MAIVGIDVVMCAHCAAFDVAVLAGVWRESCTWLPLASCTRVLHVYYTRTYDCLDIVGISLNWHWLELLLCCVVYCSLLVSLTIRH